MLDGDAPRDGGATRNAEAARYGTVGFSVACVDALTWPVDVLVLKYAQALYGVDWAVATTLGVPPGRLPAVGEHLLVDGRPGTAAQSVLFLGMPPLYEFGYGDVRRFAQRALSAARQVRPTAKEIALTLHGPGFGLDETEAIEAEVAGLIDGVSAGSFPPGLESVVFLEADERRAERIASALTRLLPAQPTGAVDASATDRLRSVGDESGKRGHAFVAMPFAGAFDDVFHYGISPPIREVGLLCERMDKIAFTGDIVHRMRERIGEAKFIVADLTGANPNVYLEVGYAWGRDVPTILVCGQDSSLEFDVKGHRCLIYSSIRDLEQQLSTEIRRLLA